MCVLFILKALFGTGVLARFPVYYPGVILLHVKSWVGRLAGRFRRGSTPENSPIHAGLTCIRDAPGPSRFSVLAMLTLGATPHLRPWRPRSSPAHLQPGRPPPDSSCSVPSTMINRFYCILYLIWTLASTDSSSTFQSNESQTWTSTGKLLLCLADSLSTLISECIKY